MPGQPARSLEATCDNLIQTLLPAQPPDDVALLLARTRALDTSQVATWDLPPDPAPVAGARAEAMARLAEWRLPDVAFTAELGVSELVTNAIRYGQPPIQLRLPCSSARCPTAAAPPRTCGGPAPSTKAAVVCCSSPSSPSAGGDTPPCRREDDLGGDQPSRRASVTGPACGLARRQRPLTTATPDELYALQLPDGSLRPTAEAAASFVERTDGFAATSPLDNASGTLVQPGTRHGKHKQPRACSPACRLR